jgi:hypothetical protein
MAQFEKLDKTVFFYPNAHSIAMATDGVERLRIDAKGQFGFGTKGELDPKERVRIQGETGDATTLALNVTDSNKRSLLAVRDDGSVGIGIPAPLTTEISNPNENSSIGAKGEVKERLRIQAETNDATKLAINVTNAEKKSLFIVRNDGNVGIGISPDHQLDVNGNINYGQLTKLDVAENFSAVIRAADLLLGYSGRRGSPGRALVDIGSELHINYAGDWTQGVRYYVSMELASSQELKENIAPLSAAEAMGILSGLEPVQFTLKADPARTPHVGFIAEHVPSIIASRDHKAINNDHIVAVLTKVVKQQQESIAALNERVRQLEAANKSRRAATQLHRPQTRKRGEGTGRKRGGSGRQKSAQ